MTLAAETEFLRIALIVTIVAATVIVAGTFAYVRELRKELRETRQEVRVAQREAEDARARAERLQEISARAQELANAEILRLSVQLAALQRGAVVSDELARHLTVPDINALGANGGVRTYLTLAGDMFSQEDLEDLAFRNGVEWDALAGDTKPAKARELVRWFVSRDRLADLKRSMRAVRPELHI